MRLRISLSSFLPSVKALSTYLHFCTCLLLVSRIPNSYLGLRHINIRTTLYSVCLVFVFFYNKYLVIFSRFPLTPSAVGISVVPFQYKHCNLLILCSYYLDWQYWTFTRKFLCINSGYCYGRLHINSLEFRSTWGISALTI